MKFRDLCSQVHRLEYPLGDGLGLDEGDEAELVVLNVFLRSSAHGMYIDLLVGLSCSASAGSAGAGTTHCVRHACDKRTPK